jgi:hypothetical protein
MITSNATAVNNHEIVYETIPVCGWEWPDEAVLSDFAEKNDRMEQADRIPEHNAEYAALYFVS